MVVEAFGAEYCAISQTVDTRLPPLLNLGNILKNSVADPAGKYWASAKSLPETKASTRVLITKLAPTLSGRHFAVLLCLTALIQGMKIQHDQKGNALGWKQRNLAVCP